MSVISQTTGYGAGRTQKTGEIKVKAHQGLAQTRSQGTGTAEGRARQTTAVEPQGRARAGQRERDRLDWPGRKVCSSRREVQAVDGPLFQAIQEPDLVYTSGN
ncbi:hypothetical protein VTJ04DRAFT_4385 [Mycothermus thermophilus]|uniref:uncharacterized protein n=1 Tax=Humicola insolens TaxID=85995 RepID=UPI00374205E5